MPRIGFDRERYAEHVGAYDGYLSTFLSHVDSLMVDSRDITFNGELGVLLPAVLCLQEVRFESDGASLQLKTIAAETGLHVVSARAQHGRKDGGLSGNAVLSALPVLASVPSTCVHLSAR